MDGALARDERSFRSSYCFKCAGKRSINGLGFKHEAPNHFSGFVVDGSAVHKLNRVDRVRDCIIGQDNLDLEIDRYRPVFVMGEVGAPGQYAFVPGMTAQKAIAAAGGFMSLRYGQ